ncbi:MAG: CBS domain-containing protein [Candidatus Sedimenticola sp. (ex Thyasira tokunagai)]
MEIREIVELVKDREVPIVSETCPLEAMMNIMHGFQHSRLVYVVNKQKELIGTISLDMLVRHILPHKFEPRIHPRRLLEMVTHEIARDIMLKNPVTATEDEDVELVLQRMIDANVQEIAILSSGRKVIIDLTMVDLLKSLPNLH